MPALLPNPPLPALGGALLAGVADALTALFRAAVRGLVQGALGPLAGYLLRTPDLLGQPTLRGLWLASLACFAVLAGGLLAVAAAAAVTGRISPALPLARLVSCALTAGTALPLVALEARLADVLVGVFVPAGSTLTTTPAVDALRDAAAGSGTAQLGLLAVAAVGAAFLAVLAVQALLRWAALWALVILAPLVCALGLLPTGAGPATLRLWWRLQTAAVFLPVADAALFAGYAALFGSRTAGFAGALAGVGVLVLMARLPVWAAGQLVHLTPRDVATPARRLAYDVARFTPSSGRAGPAGRPNGGAP